MTYAEGQLVHIEKGKEKGTCTLSAYNRVWKERGFRLVDPQETRRIRRQSDDVVFEGGLPPVDVGSDTKTAGNQAADTKKEGAK